MTYPKGLLLADFLSNALTAILVFAYKPITPF